MENLFVAVQNRGMLFGLMLWWTVLSTRQAGAMPHAPRQRATSSENCRFGVVGRRRCEGLLERFQHAFAAAHVAGRAQADADVWRPAGRGEETVETRPHRHLAVGHPSPWQMRLSATPAGSRKDLGDLQHRIRAPGHGVARQSFVEAREEIGLAGLLTQVQYSWLGLLENRNPNYQGGGRNRERSRSKRRKIESQNRMVACWQ